MNVFDTPARVLIGCYKRLSPYLQAEVQALGFTPESVTPTGVSVTATLNQCIALNLNLRTASQVLYSLKTFTAATPDELYDQLSTIAWEEIIDYTGYFSVTGFINNPAINNSLFANLRVKDAIADRIMQKRGLRPDSGKNSNKAVIHLYWQGSNAEVFIDTSGEKLLRHGYRKMPGAAPMLETLAASVIMALGYNGQGPFVNPMCGSGTLAIEAALIATNRRPGLLRMNYGFMHILGYKPEIFELERQKVKQLVNKNFNQPIIATDVLPKAIQEARHNAQTAGVDHLITFKVCDYRDTPAPQSQAGTVVFNPEYGERLGDITELEEVYAGIGDYMKTHCKGYTGAVFTGNPTLAKKIGLKASKKLEFYNGTLDCRLLTYELYEGSRRPAQD